MMYVWVHDNGVYVMVSKFGDVLSVKHKYAAGAYVHPRC